MKCDFCDQKATVFFTQVTDGAMKKIALCESCAQKKGIEDPEGFLIADHLLKPLGSKPSPKPQVAAAGVVLECSSCGFSADDYQKVGRLGCADCYTIFQGEIEPRLPSIHKGVFHQGRVPEGLVEAEKLREQLAGLQQDLEKAIAEEDYENAATLRDRIHKFEMHDDDGEEESLS